MYRISELTESISGGSRAAHAFVIEGRAGGARMDFISSLAAGLECSSAGARPCGKCPSCLQAAAGTNPDIIRMSKSSGSAKGSREIYRTSDAAAFIERLGMGAYGRHLIGIIDDADQMSEAVQNKLLKTLEEPSPGTVILLAASNRDSLLSTVLSRTSLIRMSDYEDVQSGITSSEEDADGPDDAAMTEAAAMFLDRSDAFCSVRSTVDKLVRKNEDAYRLLDIIEDTARERMIEAARSGRRDSAERLAAQIELVNLARMDIRRDMKNDKALKRLYLDLGGWNR